MFVAAKLQGASFASAQCILADFLSSDCSGADFSHALMQGSKFSETVFEGAYAYEDDNGVRRQSLSIRVHQVTEVNTAVFGGPVDPVAVSNIIASKNLFSGLVKFQEILNVIKENEGKDNDYEVPSGIRQGILKEKSEIIEAVRLIEGR